MTVYGWAHFYLQRPLGSFVESTHIGRKYRHMMDLAKLQMPTFKPMTTHFQRGQNLEKGHWEATPKCASLMEGLLWAEDNWEQGTREKLPELLLFA